MEKKSLSQLIRLSDFAQIKHTVYLKNETSQTSFVHDGQISLKEMGANYMIMEGPAECCQAGHQLSLTLVPGSKKKSGKIPSVHSRKDTIQLIARVEQYNLQDDRKMATWTVRFTQYNIKEWNAIIESYQKQQDKINELLNS